MLMLRLFFSVFGEFQAPSIGWNMNYSVFSRFQWIRVDANILETMPRKTEEKKIILVRVDKVLDRRRYIGVCFGPPVCRLGGYTYFLLHCCKSNQCAGLCVRWAEVWMTCTVVRLTAFSVFLAHHLVLGTDQVTHTCSGFHHQAFEDDDVI